MNTETQRNLAQEQLKQRKPNWLERWLGLDQQREQEPEMTLQPAPEPEPGFITRVLAFLETTREKATDIGDSIRAYFQSTPRELEIVHIGADKTSAKPNIEAQELQVRDSLAAVLGTFTPGQTPFVARTPQPALCMSRSYA